MHTFTLFFWVNKDAISPVSGYQLIHCPVNAESPVEAVRALRSEFSYYERIESFLVVGENCCTVVYPDYSIGDDWAPVTVITDN